MLKTKAIELLGGTAKAAAEAIGITPQAVCQWPDELPPRIADRVYAVWGKKNMPVLAATPSEATGNASAQAAAAPGAEPHTQEAA